MREIMLWSSVLNSALEIGMWDAEAEPGRGAIPSIPLPQPPSVAATVVPLDVVMHVIPVSVDELELLPELVEVP